MYNLFTILKIVNYMILTILGLFVYYLNISDYLMRFLFNLTLKNFNIQINTNIDNYNDYNSLIIVSNHYNMTDYLILNSLFLNNYTIVKDDLFSDSLKNTSFLEKIYLYLDKYISKGVKLIKYKRNDKNSGIIVKNTIVDYIKQRRNIIVFPEGTSSRSGKPLEFKNGLFKLAQEKHIDILPITLKYEKNIGLNKEDKFNLNDLFNINCHIYVHPKVSYKKENLKEHVHNIILKKYEELDNSTY